MPPFDLSQLAPVLASLSPNSNGGFLRGWQRAQQEKAERQEREQAMALRTSADARATAAEARAAQDQTRQNQQHVLAQGTSVSSMLADPNMLSEEELMTRATFLRNLAPQIGVDPGFIELETRRAVQALPKKRAESLYTRLTRGLSAEQVNQLRTETKTYQFEGFPQPVTFNELEAQVRGAAIPATTPKPPTPKALQQKEVLINGQRAFVNFDPDDGKMYDQSGKEVTGAVPIPPVSAMQQGAAGASPRQIATFNQIAGAFERSPLIRAADRTVVLSDAIKAIEKNPSDPASQLSLSYAFIQALDTYQSAVREGELQNLGILGTRLQQWATQLNRVAFEGAFLPPEVAKNIAVNARQLVRTIETARDRKAKEFGSRARVSGVGEMWDEFVAGAGPSQETGEAPKSRIKSATRVK